MTNKENISYTVMKINDRAVDNVNRTTQILSNFNRINDIKFYNGYTEDCNKLINDLGIRTDSWNPVLFGEKSNRDPLPGELGIILSTLSVLNYIVDNNLEYLLVLEDDAILEEDAKEKILYLIKDLPVGWDFLSLFCYFEEENAYTEYTDIGSEYIHKSTNQTASTVVMIYSLSGAKKILDLFKINGVLYTIDCFIYNQAAIGSLNGYSVRPGIIIAQHNDNQYASTIDPEKLRLTF